ncbi:MAG: arylsulfotransferase family protein [Albidovulum sp.]
MFNYIRQHAAYVISRLGVVFLVFFAGLSLGVLSWQPAPLLREVINSARELKGNIINSLSDTPQEHLLTRSHPGNGVVISDPARMQPGVTFLAGLFGNRLGFRLYAEDGTLLHEWPIDFFTVAPDEMRHKFHALMHGTHLYENGDVVANLVERGTLRFDACGKVLWRNHEQTHHSIHVDDAGVIWAPSRGPMYEEPGITRNPFPFDTIKTFNPDTGQQLHEINLVKTLVDSGLTGLVQSSNRTPTDLIHLNDVEILDRDLAPAFPMFKAGDILLSSRALQQLWVLDGTDFTIKWWFGGPTHGQHDPDFNADGTITLLDNGASGNPSEKNGFIGKLGGSRILSIDPATKTFRTLYKSDAKNTFYTNQRGKHQLLANGNILIAETDAGRAFEVTPNGDVVWSFVNGWDETRVGWVMDAARYPASYAAIADQNCDSSTAN